MNISDIDLKPNVTYYDPNAVQRKMPVKHMYKSHIVEVNDKIVNVKGKYKARVYNLTIEIAKEVGEDVFEDADGKTYNGSNFVGKKIKSKGYFLFLHPQEGDNFEANPGANDVYLKFAETIGVECPEKEVEIDGEKHLLREIPEMTEHDIVGKPVLSYVDYNSFKNKEGETVKFLQVKGFEKWSDGKERELDLEEIPF